MKVGPELTDFLGLWVLERHVEDRLSHHAPRFEGTAEFTPDGAGLAYVESGLLHVPGQASLQAERRYFWRRQGVGLAVVFEDGRPFHVIEAGLTPVAHHDCAPDVYRVRYDFTGWPAWQAVWQVKGQRKDYRMVSAYRRAGGDRPF
ncbi:DUF6314 family protein [Psychromarinibacter sp. C21-152]|uniref:DUF6314 family protein n=1 Tax=Psychromarinibacter sediminicola TaxID=3033385 RepID=A0AAE3NU21_9RHOB|nr:DUF6314 family protein [Psychromarinibacter sediminicola]MDF0602036.1 DUF6314 family protein [Psychromarinibacter sediminicola]